MNVLEIESLPVAVRSTYMQEVQANINRLLDEIKVLQINSETRIESVQSSFDEQLKALQKQICIKIKDLSDRIEKIAVKEMTEALTSLQDYLKNNVSNCTRLQHELHQLFDVIEDVSCKGKDELFFYAKRKCMNKIEQSNK